MPSVSNSVCRALDRRGALAVQERHGDRGADGRVGQQQPERRALAGDRRAVLVLDARVVEVRRVNGLYLPDVRVVVAGSTTRGPWSGSRRRSGRLAVELLGRRPQRRADQQAVRGDQDRLAVGVDEVANFCSAVVSASIDRAEVRRSCSSCCPCEEARRVGEQQHEDRLLEPQGRHAAQQVRDLHERAQVVVDHHLPGEGDDRAERRELVGVARVGQADVLQLAVRATFLKAPVESRR
jgi:hypothetical protein